MLSRIDSDPIQKREVFGQVRFADQHLLLPLMTSTLDLGLKVAAVQHQLLEHR
jgi:hypothetical protein